MNWALPSFFSTQPIQWNALLIFGSLLLSGLVGGYIVTRTPWIPRITGYLLVGFILGVSGLDLISGDVLKLANLFADIAVALIIYQLGRYVDIGWLRREKWLLATVLTSSVLCFAFVSGALLWFGSSKIIALLSGVLAIATAPAVTMVVVRDLKAEGLVTRRLATMTALNNFVAILATYALLPVIAHENTTSFTTLLTYTLYSISGSLLLAYLTYRLMIPLARLLGRQRSRQFTLVIAMITLTIGAAHALQLPVLLTMLVFAIMSKNMDRQYDLMELEFGIANELFVTMLFVTLGATIRITDLSTVGLSVVIVIAARFLAMSSGIFTFAYFARIRWKQAALLSLATLPMTEAGLSLIQTISYLYPQTISDIRPLLAGCLIVLELCGPIATQFALIQSGESGREN